MTTVRHHPLHRPTWAEVDLSAIRDNVSHLREMAGTELCAVVKADAYGHGAAQVSRAALAGGASWLAVALVEEGIALRESGIDARILLLSEPPPHAMSAVVEHRLTPTLYTRSGVEAAVEAARAFAVGDPVPVHVKIDTGMHRVGADPGGAKAVANAVHSEDGLFLEGIWTHFAVADEPDRDDVTARQLELFHHACAALPPAEMYHAANSAGLIAHRSARLDLVRAGIAVYGGAPSPALAHLCAGLRPAMSLKACVSYAKRVAAGESLSYGLRYTVEVDSLIATVPLGYADGVPRRLSEVGGEVLIGGRRRPIAGTVTMDQLLVDCGPSEQVSVGDEVVLIGRQGDGEILADEWASLIGTINYEILCGIGPRVPRVYLEA